RRRRVRPRKPPGAADRKVAVMADDDEPAEGPPAAPEPTEPSVSPPPAKPDVAPHDGPELDRPSASAPIRSHRLAGLRQRIEHAHRSLVPRSPEVEPTRWRRVWLLTFFVLRRWIIEDRSGGMAALLTIHTLLSTVPTIGVALLIVGLMDPA